MIWRGHCNRFDAKKGGQGQAATSYGNGIFTKSSYSSWTHYFDEGEGSHNGLIMEALSTYWLSWFIFLSALEDVLKDYIFPLTILLAKGKNVALAPIYLGPLYARLDDCVANVA